MPVSKKTLSFIQSLRIKKYREQHQLFVVEGDKPVRELVNSALQIHSMYAVSEWLEEHHSTCNAIPTYDVTPKELEQLCSQKNPNLVLAIAHIPTNNFTQLHPNQTIHLVLDDIRDPGNLGTIIRTAEWFGCKEIYCSETCVDVYNPKTVQAAMGSAFRLNIHYTNLQQLITQNSYPVYGALLNGAPLEKVIPTKPFFLVIGNEANGINNALQTHITQRITITDSEGQQAESLNAAVATGILLHHFSSVLKK